MVSLLTFVSLFSPFLCHCAFYPSSFLHVCTCVFFQAQNLTVYLERVAASRVFPPMKNTEPILSGGSPGRLLPFGMPPPAASTLSSLGHFKGSSSASTSSHLSSASTSGRGGLGGRWRVALELSEGVLAFRALNSSLYPGEYGGGDVVTTPSSSSGTTGKTKAAASSANLPDKRGWSPVLHADVPKCHARRNARLSECILLGIPGAVRSPFLKFYHTRVLPSMCSHLSSPSLAGCLCCLQCRNLACSLCLFNYFQVHPPGYVHQLFADAIVASVLHPALIQATAASPSSSACATSASSLQASPSSSHSSKPPKAIPPLPSPLDPAADPLADHDDVIASCTQPLTFFSAALSPPPFPYAFPKASSGSKRGGADTGREEKATSSSTSRSGAVPFAPLSPPRGWAFGPDLAGKPAGWITPAERWVITACEELNS